MRPTNAFTASPGFRWFIGVTRELGIALAFMLGAGLLFLGIVSL